MVPPLTCWRCEQPGHVAAECQRPAPKTRQELEHRINRHIERWDAGYGVITKTQMHEFIRLETQAWKGKAA